jgi:hypothetical protein
MVPGIVPGIMAASNLARDFDFDDFAQCRQRTLHSIPHKLRGDVFIIVAIDISCTSHLLPCDGRMPRLQIVGQAARRFGIISRQRVTA